ncbi:purine-nucleoside phosphorylase [Geothermobacter ehrlichii]|uniref:Purine nucleoside phosphorylase n=1 Tax=Geothermobacter ehrlichii TaxID=213224 RepID=A0A5D3WIV8_9BACT|nr:purine-nucleoside phosphorylase [Geothermobacter ehrlichii]TYO98819.1 purine-nucleoside phosphorylase [Geothermobacter ehrlichii]
MSELISDIAAARAKLGEEPCDFALILGSGLGEVAGELVTGAGVPFSELPDCPARSLIPGHGGQVFPCRFGKLRGLVFQGRFHCYQGLSAYQAAWPVRLAAVLGVRRLVVTSAVGAINRAFAPGDPVFVEDHLNLLGDNPLRGIEPPVFADLCHLYPTELYPQLADRAEKKGIVLRRGVLAAMSGPSYETPAEIRMLERLGADVVSMSMVPETVLAAGLGLDILGLALVTNKAAGRSDARLDHREVLNVGRTFGATLRQLLPDLLDIFVARPQINTVSTF